MMSFAYQKYLIFKIITTNALFFLLEVEFMHVTDTEFKSIS